MGKFSKTALELWPLIEVKNRILFVSAQLEYFLTDFLQTLRMG